MLHAVGSPSTLACMLLERTLATFTMLTLSILIMFAASLRTKYPVALIGAYLVHFAAAIAIYAVWGLWAPDARGYDQKAQEQVAFWAGTSSVAPGNTVGKEGFTLILAQVYQAMGHYPILGIMLNVTVCALTVPVIASAADRMGLSGRRSAWLAALFPPMVLWGGLLLRESLIWLAIAIVARSLVGLSIRTTFVDIGCLALGLIGLLWLRGTAAILVGTAGLLTLIVIRRRPGPAVIGLLLAGFIVATPLAARIGQITGAYNLDKINMSRTELTLADSGFAAVSYSDPLGALKALPTMIPRTLAGPYPWEWAGMNPLFAFDAVAWLLLLFWIARGLVRTERRVALVLVGPAVAILLALAVTSGNYGTLQRLRLLSGIMLIPLAAAGIATAKPQGRSRRTRSGLSNIVSGETGGMKLELEPWHRSRPLPR